MKKLVFLLLLLPLITIAHPGVGIVKDSKGNIYYTDLKQVWKITKGKKTVIVPNVHTHELHIDQHDNLYGEGGYYDDKAVKFYHYLWVYKPKGQIDTVVGMREAYIRPDFSLARDKKGNEYYLKRFLVPHSDTSHLYRKSPEGQESVLAKGNFKNVNWLHPQEDGKLLYVSQNAIYTLDSYGNIKLVKDSIANLRPSFKFSGNNIMIWGVWQDHAKNIYAAAFSDQAVKKIDPNGNITDIYKSNGNWAPLHGVFDDDNKLWVLESSDKNETRVTLVETGTSATSEKGYMDINLSPYIFIIAIGLMLLLFYWKINSFRSGLSKLKNQDSSR